MHDNNFDFGVGQKKDVAELKFLIHDLRVEKFINECIHFHVALNTDLEIYNIEYVAALHSEDLLALKEKAQIYRKAFQFYANAVGSFSPPQTIITGAHRYISTIQDICELIINPLWGRFDKVISFLPKDAKSVQAIGHYRNCLRWICGVYYRIEHFLHEQGGADTIEDFDLGRDLSIFTRNVIEGYIAEKSVVPVEIEFGKTDSAVVTGNKHRFRRMFFNLVMNAVHSMAENQSGRLIVEVTANDGRVTLTAADNGCGMPPEKIDRLLADRQTLDGDLHSLGFVFVRQTISSFKGELTIESAVDRGTKIVIELPFDTTKLLPPERPSKCEKFHAAQSEDSGPPPKKPSRESGPTTAVAASDPSNHSPAAVENKTPDSSCGCLLMADYRSSQATFPGCIFSIAVDTGNKVEFLVHRPYEQNWDISHEDLNPLYANATIRGRIEENEEGEPELILKVPQNIRDYFEFKELDESKYSAELYNQMVCEEYIRVARKLVATGFPAQMKVQLMDLRKFFPERDDLYREEPFPLQLLADQEFSTHS